MQAQNSSADGRIGGAPLQPPPAQGEGPRITALAGRRRLATLRAPAPHSPPVAASRPTRPPAVAVPTASRWGSAAGDLFSLPAGFLLTAILRDSKGTPGYFRNFHARRSLRI